MTKLRGRSVRDIVGDGGILIAGPPRGNTRVPDAAVPWWARELRRLRRTRGMSQRDFCRLLEVSQATCNNYEQGHRRPALGTLLRLRRALDIEDSDWIRLCGEIVP